MEEKYDTVLSFDFMECTVTYKIYGENVGKGDTTVTIKNPFGRDGEKAASKK